MTRHDERLPFALAEIEIFLAVCETGKMADAARRLGLTQPAVSQAVAALEEQLGALLFDRSVRPLGLTPAGVILRQRAAALLSEARQIAPLVRASEHGQLPSIRLGLVDSLARALTVPLLDHLSGIAERVSIQSGLTAAHASALLTRSLDLFIGVDDLAELEGLERWRLMTEPYVLLLPLGSTIPRLPQELSALADTVPMIRFSERSKTGIDIERHLRRLDLDIPRRTECDTPFGVIAQVADGKGWAIATPLCLAEAALPITQLACVRLPGPAFSRSLTLVARKAELGPLPGRVADVCRRAISTSLDQIKIAVPWLKDSLDAASGAG